MPTVTISIGSNSRNGYLSNEQWNSFISNVRELFVGRPEYEVYVDGALSAGEWQGKPELSATWVVGCPTTYLNFARGWLSAAAQEFGQNAIAFTVGDTEFIGPHFVA